jgi:cytidine deaminase
MPKPGKAKLIRAALEVRERACAPYSKFQVGAALLAEDGSIYSGANVESASFGLTCCAERVALFSALAAGARRFTALAIVARIEGGPMPCGACRQLLAEYAPEVSVWICDSNTPRQVGEFSVRELLPNPFLIFSAFTPLR